MKKLIVLLIVFAGISIANSQVDRALVLNPLLKPFYHGVASGDPLSDGVIIWTRLTPDTGFVGTANVDWRIATDTGMTNVIQNGTYATDINQDYTIKVDVNGLLPDTYYYYEFTYDSMNSIRGRTKTTPVGMKDSLRFAVVSCSDYESGYFNAYKVITDKNDVDAVIHLGDYLYEYDEDPGAVGGRVHEPPNEIITLYDYRTRLSQYHLDEDLMRLHQQYPFIMVWDDHESANNSWKDGAENHDAGEGAWPDRKNYSKQAYYEWLPVRPNIIGPDTVLQRSIEFGDLIDIYMLDTRLHGREEQAGTTGGTVNDPNRTILGHDQRDWLVSELVNSSATWKIIGQQVMFAPLEIAGIGINGDQWDGYPAERTYIMSYVLANNVEGVVVLTGDIHTAWANDIPTPTYNPSNGSGSAFVEFVTPSVTTTNSPVGGLGEPVIQLANPHMKYINLADHGFFILDVNQNRTQADWFYVNTITSSDSSYHWDESWYVNQNERFLRNTITAAFPRAELDQTSAPPWPRPFPNTTSIDGENANIVFAVYPNPFTQGVYVQYHLAETAEVELSVLDMHGRQVYIKPMGKMDAGVQHTWMDINMESGVYLIQLKVNGLPSFVYRVVKN